MAVLKRRQDVFSTMMVKTYDMDFRNSIFTDQIMQRAVEFTKQKGVLYVLGSLMGVTQDAGDLKIGVGVAYIDGERLQVESEQTLAITEGEDIAVWIQHVAAADVDAHATRLDDVGAPHTVWYTDGYLIGKTDWSVWLPEPPSDKLLLARADKTSGVITITDKRVYLTLGLPLPDLSVLTAALANLAVTHAKIANLAVNAGKIADLGVTEGKLAAGTDLVPLIEDIQTKNLAGESINPATAKINYACNMGGGYEYKIFGRVLRMIGTAAGPIRKLRLVGTVEASGAGTGTLYLVAWLQGTPPGSYDPDDPGYDGLVTSDTIEGAATDTYALQLDISGLGTDDVRIAYGVVMRNNTASTIHLYNLTLVGIR